MDAELGFLIGLSKRGPWHEVYPLADKDGNLFRVQLLEEGDLNVLRTGHPPRAGFGSDRAARASTRSALIVHVQEVNNRTPPRNPITQRVIQVRG